MGLTPKTLKKTYTAAYSARAGKNGLASADETAHIVELFANRRNDRGGLVWESRGETLCGIPAERDSTGRNLVAAKNAGVDDVRCQMCSFRLNVARGETRTPQTERRPGAGSVVVDYSKMLNDTLSKL